MWPHGFPGFLAPNGFESDRDLTSTYTCLDSYFLATCRTTNLFGGSGRNWAERFTAWKGFHDVRVGEKQVRCCEERKG